MKILFEHQHLYYLPQFEPMINVLKARGHNGLFGSICESVPDIEKNVFQENMARLGLKTIQANFEPQRCRILKDEKFDLIFIGNKTSLNSIAVADSFVVMIYHGIGLKQSYYTDLTDRLNLIAVESSFRAEKLNNLGYTAVDCGFIKLDYIPKLSNQGKQSRMRDMGLNPDKPTLLYAPTFYPSSLKKTIPILPDLVSEMNVMVKLHQFNWTMPRYTPLNEKLLDIERRVEGLALIGFDQFNVLDIFPLADLLVSDFSSTLFEFLPWDKPIIQTAYFTPRFKHIIFPAVLNRRMDKVRTLEADFMYNCSRPDALVGIVKDVVNKDGQSKPYSDDLKQRFLGRMDGGASERLVEAMISRGLDI